MALSEEDEGFFCPVCNEDLTEQNSLWRQIHINTCLSKAGKPEEKPCQTNACPICNADLSNLSAQVAERHINRCLDNQARHESLTRTSERCPFCGVNLKGMSERQRKVHQQMCRETEKATESSVYQYPKVVEYLETPAEWEIVQETGPILVDYSKQSKESNETPIFGEIFTTSQLQLVDKHFYSNIPIISKK